MIEVKLSLPTDCAALVPALKELETVIQRIEFDPEYDAQRHRLLAREHLSPFGGLVEPVLAAARCLMARAVELKGEPPR